MKLTIIKALQKEINLPEEQITALLEVPPKPELGDFAFPCFTLAKTLKKAPQQIAQDISENITLDFCEKIQSTGPYVNFFIKPEAIVQTILPQVLEQKENYGKQKKNNQTILIDYSAPNVAKNMGIHNLRSTIIGQALYNAYTHCGYTVIGINHLGDWGTQFGKLIWALEKWSSPEELQEKGILFLNELYVKFHTQAEQTPEIEDEARAWFKKIEENDKRAHMWWKLFIDISLKDYADIYKRLNVSFDQTKGESFYIPMLDKTVERLKPLTTQSEGAQVIEIDETMPPLLLKKSDGATLYGTRDLAAAFYRLEEHNPTKILYIVDIAQSLHFKQVFGVMEKIDPKNKDIFMHVEFGRLSFPDATMSTRKGNIVPLREVLDKAKEKALSIIEEKNPTLKDKETVAEQVGIGAIIFGDLSHDRVHNITFEWDTVLDFQGETAPYIQYTIARINSILAKSEQTKNADLTQLTEEKELIKQLARFPDILQTVVKQNKPHHIAIYAVKLAQQFNAYYANTKIRGSQKEQAQLQFITAVKYVLENCMKLLGINCPEQM